MADRLKKGIPRVAPITLNSDTPKEVLKVIDMLPTLGALRGVRGIQIDRVQSDNTGEFVNEPLISGCRS
eukprot:6446295-Prorocentrum_lima.AAC.1